MIDISGIAAGGGNGEVPHVALSRGQQWVAKWVFWMKKCYFLHSDF